MSHYHTLPFIIYVVQLFRCMAACHDWSIYLQWHRYLWHPQYVFLTSQRNWEASSGMRLFLRCVRDGRVYAGFSTGQFPSFHYFPDRNVHGTNMGPIWGRQDQGGPHLGPVNFAIWVPKCLSIIKTHFSYWISRLYLAGVDAAQLRWHLTNMNVIQRI